MTLPSFMAEIAVLSHFLAKFLAFQNQKPKFKLSEISNGFFFFDFFSFEFPLLLSFLDLACWLSIWLIVSLLTSSFFSIWLIVSLFFSSFFSDSILRDINIISTRSTERKTWWSYCKKLSTINHQNINMHQETNFLSRGCPFPDTKTGASISLAPSRQMYYDKVARLTQGRTQTLFLI